MNQILNRVRVLGIIKLHTHLIINTLPSPRNVKIRILGVVSTRSLDWCKFLFRSGEFLRLVFMSTSAVQDIFFVGLPLDPLGTTSTRVSLSIKGGRRGNNRHKTPRKIHNSGVQLGRNLHLMAFYQLMQNASSYDCQVAGKKNFKDYRD